MNLDLILSEQNKILDLINQKNYKITIPKTDSLKKILSINDHTLKYCLGEFGLRLKSFVKDIDLKHPDLCKIFDGQLTNNVEDSFIKQLEDLFEILKITNKKQISKLIIDNFKISIFSHKFFRKLDLLINSPLANSIHVRLLSSKRYKKNSRLTKKFQKIKLNIQNNYKDTSDNFSDFFRSIEFEEKIVKETCFLKNNFINHGLNCLAKKIEANFRQIIFDDYFGFKKITLDKVASILLKQIEIEKENFDISNISIRAYSFHEVDQNVNKQIKELVAYLDNFPDIGYRSLFDHFRVVICSPKIAEKPTGSSYEFCDNKNILYFDNLDEAQKYFDFYLIKEKITIGALVGDRDGDHFFISYFL